MTAAYRLAVQGRRVTLLDRHWPGREASWAGAGIIPPGNPLLASTPIDRLRARSVIQFPHFSAELRERTGIDNGFFICGGIEFLSEADEDVIDLWKQEQIVHSRLTVEEFHALEGGLALPGSATAFHLPGCAQVRNPWHVRALISACENVGVKFQLGIEAVGWVREAERIKAVKIADGSIVSAAEFIVASGAWAEGLLVPLGCCPGVHPVRGQIVLYRADPRPFRNVLMHGKRYLVPRADGRILVGSTEEPEAGFEKANTPVGIAGLREFAEQLVPALTNAAVEQTWAGLRPGSRDGMPMIGRVPGVMNVYAAVGHGRAGVQLSLITADLLIDAMSDREGPDSAAFRFDRALRPPGKSAFRS